MILPEPEGARFDQHQNRHLGDKSSSCWGQIFVWRPEGRGPAVRRRLQPRQACHPGLSFRANPASNLPIREADYRVARKGGLWLAPRSARMLPVAVWPPLTRNTAAPIARGSPTRPKLCAPAGIPTAPVTCKSLRIHPYFEKAGAPLPAVCPDQTIGMRLGSRCVGDRGLRMPYWDPVSDRIGETRPGVLAYFAAPGSGASASAGISG